MTAIAGRYFPDVLVLSMFTFLYHVAPYFHVLEPDALTSGGLTALFKSSSVLLEEVKFRPIRFYAKFTNNGTKDSCFWRWEGRR